MRLDQPGTPTVQATVRNPLGTGAVLSARLSARRGWRREERDVQAAAREDVRLTLSIEVPEVCRRQPIALELRIGERLYGQVCEALVTVGARF